MKKRLPKEYVDSPVPKEVGDKVFSLTTMTWETVGESEVSRFSKKDWVKMMVKRGRYTKEQAEKFFSDSEKDVDIKTETP